MLPRQIAHLGLGHLAQRKTSAAELLLGKAKEEISLVLGRIGSPLQQPAIALCIELATRIVAGSQQVSADLPGSDQQLVKLEMVIAEAARNRSPSGEILLHKRTHHVVLKPLLVVHHVIRNAEVLGYTSGVVNIVDGATPPLHVFR